MKNWVLKKVMVEEDAALWERCKAEVAVVKTEEEKEEKEKAKEEVHNNTYLKRVYKYGRTID